MLIIRSIVISGDSDCQVLPAMSVANEELDEDAELFKEQARHRPVQKARVYHHFYSHDLLKLLAH